MKKISICVACYNEEENINYAYDRIVSVMETIRGYEFEIIFSDNKSTDNSRKLLKELAGKDNRVKLLFNARNYGAERNGMSMLLNATGDALIFCPCDMQDPPELFMNFIHEWEKGNLVVWGQKTESEESTIAFACRKIYYKIIDKMSDVKQLYNVTGFGLMDRTVVEEIRRTEEKTESFRHIVTDLGYDVKLVPYKQAAREHGKSKYGLWRYLAFSIESLIRTSVAPIRLMTVIGVGCSVISFIFGIIYLIYKLLYWDEFQAGIAPIIIAVLFMGSIQLMSIGIMGEYVSIILTKVTKRPVAVIEKKINFDEEKR